MIFQLKAQPQSLQQPPPPKVNIPCSCLLLCLFLPSPPSFTSSSCSTFPIILDPQPRDLKKKRRFKIQIISGRKYRIMSLLVHTSLKMFFSQVNLRKLNSWIWSVISSPDTVRRTSHVTVLCFRLRSLCNSLRSCSSALRGEEHEDRWGNHLQYAGVLADCRLQKCPTLSTELHQRGRPSGGDGKTEVWRCFHENRLYSFRPRGVWMSDLAQWGHSDLKWSCYWRYVLNVFLCFSLDLV